jgi:hypothetical protein
MKRRLHISTGNISVEAILNDSSTADAIWDALPFKGKINLWGDEIYFTIPVRCAEESDARQDMSVGELGYWPSGSAFCIFFGPTPASETEAPRAYSNVNPFGWIEGDATIFRAAVDGDDVLVQAA